MDWSSILPTGWEVDSFHIFIYILSQVLAVVEYGLLGASYLAKKRKTVVILDIASMTLGIIVYLLLGADSGLAMSVVILLANFYYLYDEKDQGESNKMTLRDYVALGIVLVTIGVLAVLTYDEPLSLLSVLATVLYEISIFWQNGSTMVYQFLGIPVALSWMTYNGFAHSPSGVVCEFCMLVASTVGFVRAIIAERKARKRKRGKGRKTTAKAKGVAKRTNNKKRSAKK